MPRKSRKPTGDKEMGERVKAKRLALGMTQDALAERSELSQATISAVENGEHGLERAQLETLARALQETPAFLQYGQPAPRGEGLGAVHELQSLWESFLQELTEDKRFTKTFLLKSPAMQRQLMREFIAFVTAREPDDRGDP